MADISEWWGGQENIKLLDSNLLACDEHLDLLRQLAETGAHIDITQGLDARLLTEKNISLINELKIKALHFAWDNPRDKSVVAALQNFRKASRIKNHRKLIVYVLCNYWSSREEDLYRVYWLRDNGFDPYIMSKKKKSVEYDLFADFGAVDAENIVAGAVVKAAQESQTKESPKKSQRIEDFGEKIGGARKDLYAAYCDLIKVAIESEVESVPLSKSFPAPNYKKLLESGVES